MAEAPISSKHRKKLQKKIKENFKDKELTYNDFVDLNPDLYLRKTKEGEPEPSWWLEIKAEVDSIKRQKTSEDKALEGAVGEIVRYSPDSVPTKPSKQPSKAEIETVYRFENGRIVEV
ncbi:MAG: hypothetical protein AAGG55_07285 [Pseudomonadota bacterium]